MNLAERRPILVKLGNSSPERPQSGLDAADVVIEHLTEGGITRFAAVYYCRDSGEIGPIRSARLIDLELVPMFDAIFAHVGGSAPVRELIAASPVAASDLDDYGREPIFREVETRKRPFNRYSTTRELYDLARDNGWLPGRTPAGLAFTSSVPAGGRPAMSVEIPYSRLAAVSYAYEPAAGVYRRAMGGSPHVEATSNQPLTAANVVIIHAIHETTNIEEDSLGSKSIRIKLDTSGKALALRDGQTFDLTWSRPGATSVLEFRTAGGEIFAMKPGTVWMQVVPPDMQVKLQ
jgi:hypothetical protein